MNRRGFLTASLGFGANVFIPAAPFRQQAPTCIRKSVTSLEDDAPEILLYRRAVSIMKGLPPTDKRNWIAQANIHACCCPHTNWWFLPWHRVYLYYFEQICRDVLQNSDFALPYWDWTRYPYIPDPFLDKNSSLWNDGRALDGTVAAPLEAINTKEIGKVLTAQSIYEIYSGRTQSDDQAASSRPGELENVPHGAVHAAVGGDMWSKLSPRDPIFWLHHCNVDRIWQSWAAIHGSAAPDDPMWSNHQLSQFFDPVSKQQVTVKCAQTLNSALFSARYDRLETAEQIPGLLPAKVLQILWGPAESVSLPPGMLSVEQRVPRESAKFAPGKTLFDITLNPELQKFWNSIGRRPLRDGVAASISIFLFLDSVPVPESPSTLLRVFVGDPDSTPPVSFNDAGYAATLSFFGSFIHKEHTKTSDFALNITSTIASLNSSTPKDHPKISVTLQRFDPLNRAEKTEPAPVPERVRLIALD